MKDMLETILGELNTVFLSEADFQFTLAWKIQEELKAKGKGKVILEYPEEPDGKRVYYDIWVDDEAGETHLIELKYRTKEANVERYGETFTLKNQSAQDMGRYHFMADIQRLEKQNSATGKCYCIILTNDKAYWIKPTEENRSRSSQDAAFRIHQDRVINGKFEKFEWKDKKSYRENDVNAPIEIQNEYTCDWKHYPCGASSAEDTKNCEFKYLLLEIPPSKK